MRVVRLHGWPDNPEPKTRPVCQADVQVSGDWNTSTREEWHAKGVRRYKLLDRPCQCTFLAVAVIDGKPLCRRHAGHVALDWLMAQQVCN